MISIIKRKRLYLHLSFSILFALSTLPLNAQILLKRTTMLVGNKFDLTIVDANSVSAGNQINKVIAEVSRIENLISDWIPSSQISNVNINAGIWPVKVDPEVFQLTKRAVMISGLTKQPNGEDWKIGITNPFRTNKLIVTVPLNEGAVTTSGNYEKYIKLNGKRYSHIINPVTGYPATGLCSATVVGPDAEFANGLSTSIIVLGKEAGLKLISNYPAFSAILITDNGKVYKSDRMKSKRLK